MTLPLRIAASCALPFAVRLAVAASQKQDADPSRRKMAAHDAGIQNRPSNEGGSASLPPTPALPPGMETGSVSLEGGCIFYAALGRGRPVIFLHGGLANSNYWARQLASVGLDHRVVALDFMGHGRSTVTSNTITYPSLARNVIGVMDHLQLPRAAIVGWSDGAIVGLELALRHADRFDGGFCFGANYDRGGLIAGGGGRGAFPEYARRCEAEYLLLSPQPEGYQNLHKLMARMWTTEPNFARQELAAIKAPMMIADGDLDEIIKRSHTQDLAAAIPGSRLIFEPGASHFAMLQTPERVSSDIGLFIDSLR